MEGNRINDASLLRLLKHLHANEILAGILVVAVVVIYRYQGVPANAYSIIYSYLNGMFSFSHDIYLAEGIYTKTSGWWDLVQLVGINFDNDIFGIIVAMLLGVLSVIGAYKFVILYIGGSIRNAYILTLLLLTLDGFLLLDSNTAVITRFYATPTNFAHVLLFWALYYLIAEKPIQLTIVIFVMSYFSFKVAWPIELIVVVYSVFSKKYRLLYVLLPSLLYIYYLSAKHGIVLQGHNEAISSIELIKKRNTSEDLIYLQSIEYQWLLLGGMAYIYFRNKIKHVANNFDASVVFSTTIIVFVDYIYSQYLYVYFPIPEIILMSMARATNVLSFVFFVRLFSDLMAKGNVGYAVIVVIIVMVNFEYSLHLFGYNDLNKMLLYGVLSYFLVFYISDYFKFEQKKYSSYLITILFIYVCFMLYRFYVMKPFMFDERVFKETGKIFFQNRNRHLISTALDLRNCHNDFNVLVVLRNTITPDIIEQRQIPWLAGKSRYLSDYGAFYLNPKMLNTYNNRLNVMRKFGSVSFDYDSLVSDHLLVVSDKKYDWLYKYEKSGSYYLYPFGINFRSKCLEDDGYVLKSPIGDP